MAVDIVHDGLPLSRAGRRRRAGRGARPRRPSAFATAGSGDSHRMDVWSTATLAAGVVVLLATVVDVLWTTLWPDGEGGPLATAVTTPLVLGVRRLAGRHPRAASTAGPLALVVSVLTWMLLLWTGWVLVFSANPASLVDVSGGVTTLPGRIYFVGYTIFTMGNGDFSPVSGGWQLATAVATASGMLIVTLVVTYLLQVVGAVADKRAFAASVSGVGATPEAIVEAGWDGRDLRSLDLVLQSLAAQLSSIVDQHRAFPVLHHFRTADRERAPAVAVAVLDDALTAMCHGVRADGPSRPIVRSLRSSIGDYLDVLQPAFVLDRPAPDPPDLRRIADSGIPTVDGAEWARVAEELDDRRRRLRGAVEGDGWRWREADAA